ncbi:unnamed protein product, partial [Allacma fusca]
MKILSSSSDCLYISIRIVGIISADGAGLSHEEITATQPANIAQNVGGSREITCWPHFTPDQLVRSFEPE